MTTDDYKDEVINGKSFRIGLIDALIGSRIVNALMVGMSKVQAEREDTKESSAFRELTPQEKGEAAVQAMWMFAGNDLPSAKYEEFQKACLQCCAIYLGDDNSAPTPVLLANGRWADKRLSHDVPTINELIMKTLQFNFSPFFIESASNEPAGTAHAPTRPHRSPPSMATPIAR